MFIFFRHFECKASYDISGVCFFYKFSYKFAYNLLKLDKNINGIGRQWSQLRSVEYFQPIKHKIVHFCPVKHLYRYKQGTKGIKNIKEKQIFSLYNHVFFSSKIRFFYSIVIEAENFSIICLILYLCRIFSLSMFFFQSANKIYIKTVVCLSFRFCFDTKKKSTKIVHTFDIYNIIDRLEKKGNE